MKGCCISRIFKLLFLIILILAGICFYLGYQKAADAEAEKALGHAWGNNVTRAYYRTDLLEQRREVMQRWADVLTAESGC